MGKLEGASPLPGRLDLQCGGLGNREPDLFGYGLVSILVLFASVSWSKRDCIEFRKRSVPHTKPSGPSPDSTAIAEMKQQPVNQHMCEEIVVVSLRSGR
jgi:hypothetical protein